MSNIRGFGKSTNFQPVIKWTGSKRSQVNEILEYFPKEIDTYYEPFCGGASVLRGLIESDIKVDKYICSDINSDLISLWNEIKNNPEGVFSHYQELWDILVSFGDSQEGIEEKKKFFNKVRDRFNKEKNPLDFMFIMRTTTNGMPRYNKQGDFNNSFHVTRNGIKPLSLKKIIYDWSEKLNDKGVQFLVQDYKEIKSNELDFLYLDPPYFNTKGIYYGTIDYEELWDWLRLQKCKYLLSFDGKSGKVDNTYAVPEDIYSDHKYIKSGNSSFKRTIGKSNNSIVYESLYIK